MQNQNRPLRNPGVAAVLSFLFTGLGQIYNGEIGKGFVLIAIQMLNAGLVIMGLKFVVVGFLIAGGLHIFTIVDAYQSAIALNNPREEVAKKIEEPKISMTPKQQLLWAIGIIVLVVLVFIHWYTTHDWKPTPIQPGQPIEGR